MRRGEPSGPLAHPDGSRLVRMHVQLKIRLACPVDAAADALRDPAVMVAVTKPLVRYRSLAARGLPRPLGPRRRTP